MMFAFMTFTRNFLNWLLSQFGENAFTSWLVEQHEKRVHAIENWNTAQKAMKRARAEENNFILTDIGLMAYRDRQNSKIVRNTPVVTDTKYLRPFAEIRASYRTHAQVTMALLDSNGQPVFVDKNTCLLQPYPTHLVAKTWLPLENLVHSGGSWSILVEVNDMPLAIHRFGWIGLADNDIVQRLSNDGELSADLRHAVQTGKFRPMSLDELLSGQED